MLENCRNAQERWGGVHLLLDRWIQDRHQLVGLYQNLHARPKASGEHLENFCAHLVDYVSAGHFEIYQQLLDEAKAFGDEQAVELVRQVWPRIETSTRVALDFNDRCDNGDCRDTVGLARELERLGQALHERFELEDCLIEVLHTAHSGQSARG